MACRLEILAQYTLSHCRRRCASICREGFRQRNDLHRTSKLIDCGRGLESHSGGLSREQIKIIIRAFDIEISEGNIDAASELRRLQRNCVVPPAGLRVASILGATGSRGLCDTSKNSRFRETLFPVTSRSTQEAVTRIALRRQIGLIETEIDR